MRASTRPTGSGASYKIYLAADALWVCCCGRIALAALPHRAGMLCAGAIKAISLLLLVLDVAHDKGSWPFRLPRPDPKLSELGTTGTGVASTSPQLRGRIRDSLRRSSRTMSYAAQQRQPARLLPVSFDASGSAGRWPTLGVTEDVLPG